MGTKGSHSALHNMTMGVTGLFLLFSLLTPSVFAEVGTPIPVTSDSATCQCGVFLLGTGTLTFSADAKPVLAGKTQHFHKKICSPGAQKLPGNISSSS